MMTYRPFSDKAPYKFSSLQINLPHYLAEEIIKWGKEKIKNENVYENELRGREKEIHLTILYGIHSESPNEVINLCYGYNPFDVTLGQISLFANDEFNVIKIEAESPQLHYLNYLFKNNIDNTQNFNNYKPHVTIAYTKKEKHLDLYGKIDFKGIKWTVNSLIFSSRNGKRTPIRLQPLSRPKALSL